MVLGHAGSIRIISTTHYVPDVVITHVPYAPPCLFPSFYGSPPCFPPFSCAYHVLAETNGDCATQASRRVSVTSQLLRTQALVGACRWIISRDNGHTGGPWALGLSLFMIAACLGLYNVSPTTARRFFLPMHAPGLYEWCFMYTAPVVQCGV